MIIKLGHRVFVRSIKRKGSVEYIDWPRLSIPYMYPIQVALDRPYGECGQTMYRTDAKDLKKLKVKVTAHDPKEQHMADKVEDMLIWIDEMTPMPDLSAFMKYLKKF